jgi:hypothetical protein
MTTHAGNDLRADALDAYLAQREADGYRVETRTAVQAVIVRRRGWHVTRWLARSSGGEGRLVVSVDADGEISAAAAEPRRW